MPSLAEITDYLKGKGVSLMDVVNSGATPSTQRMMADGQSPSQIFRAFANPDAVLNSPVAQAGSGFAPIGMAGVMTYHGTPHLVDQYKMSRIGTGEGAQAYGHGIYFAENPQVAKEYQPKGWKQSYKYQGKEGTDWQMQFQDAGDYGRAQVWESIQLHVPKDRLLQTLKEEGYPEDVIKYASGLPKSLFAPPGGRMYKQDLPDEMLPLMLRGDAPIAQQPPAAVEVLRQILKDQKYLRPTDNGPRQLNEAWRAWRIDNGGMGTKDNGEALYELLSKQMGSPSAASEYLKSIGVPGLSYFDQGSRAASRGTKNHVVWDQDLLNRMAPQLVE